MQNSQKVVERCVAVVGGVAGRLCLMCLGRCGRLELEWRVEGGR